MTPLSSILIAPTSWLIWKWLDMLPASSKVAAWRQAFNAACASLLGTLPDNDLVRLCGAVSALESVWGTSKKTSYHNYGGVTGSGTAGFVVANSDLTGSGTKKPIRWAAFHSLPDYVAWWVRWMSTSKRYSSVRQATTWRQAVEALKRAGYDASSDTYASKVLSCAESMFGVRGEDAFRGGA